MSNLQLLQWWCVHCSLAAFKTFSLSLVFRSFIMWGARDLLRFMLFEVCWASWLCRFLLFATFRKFSGCYSSDMFSVLHSFPLLKHNDRDVRPSGIVHGSLMICLFFSSFFLSLVQIILFLLISLHVHCFMSFSSDFMSFPFCWWTHPISLFWLRYFPVLKFLFGFLYLLFSFWDFLFFHLFQECPEFLLECRSISLTAALNLFSNISNLCVISALASFPLWVEISMILCMLRNFGLYPGHFRYYETPNLT